MAKAKTKTDFRSSAGECTSSKRQWVDQHLQRHYFHWKPSLSALLNLVGNTGLKRQRVGHTTAARRKQELFLAFETLQALGYKLEDVRQLKGRHIQALMDEWIAKNHEAGTIDSRLSHLRWLAMWLGKEGMILPAHRYVADPARVRRQTVATTDRSWTTNEVDVVAELAGVAQKDARVAMQLELAHAFALRVREAMLFRPHLDDLGAVLRIQKGTKGGRERLVEVKTPEQRAVVERAKAFALMPHHSMVDPRMTVAQGRRRLYYVLERVDLTRKGKGVTPHGLRHETLNDLFESVAGVPSPVRGATERADLATEIKARTIVTETAGHSRLCIGGAYYGSLRGLPRKVRSSGLVPTDSSKPAEPNSNAVATPEASAVLTEEADKHAQDSDTTQVSAAGEQTSVRHDVRRRRWRPLTAATQRASIARRRAAVDDTHSPDES